MEHKPEHIDQLFKQRLYDAAPPPPAFVWEAVERRLQKRRRRFLFWIFSMVAAGTLAGGWWYMTKEHQPKLALQVPHQTLLSNPEAFRPSTNTPQTIETSAFESERTLIPTAPPAATAAVPAGKQPSVIAKPASAARSIPENPSVVAQLPNKNTDTRSETPDAEPQVTVPGAEGKEVKYSLAFLPLELQTTLVTNQQTTNLLLFKIPIAKRKAKKTVKKCYDFAKDPTVWMLEVYGGPSWTQKVLTAAPDNRPYLNKRLNSERPDLAFNTGVNAALMLRSNFLLKTGLQYEQLTEVFEHIDPEYVKYLVEIENHGGVISVDTVGVEYGEKYLKTYNRFKMLDIPLSVGVELRKGRSGFNINAGMSFNLLFIKRGALVSPDTNEPVWFTDGLNSTPDKPVLEVFKSNVGLSASASVQWFYHLKPRVRVYVEPYFRKILNPVSLPAHPVQQRYGIGGVKFGVAKIL